MTTSSPARKYFQLEAERTPALTALIESAVSPTYSYDDIFGLQDSFQAFIDSGELLSIINNELSVMRRNPEYVPHGSNGNTILLFDAPKISLTATVLDQNNMSMDKIYSAAGDAMFGNVSREAIPLRFHTIPEACDLDVFDTAHAVLPGEMYNLAPRATVAIPARRTVTEYLCTKQATLVKLTSRLYPPLVWVYDKKTGVPRFSSSGDLQGSRLQSSINLLSALEAGSVVPSDDSIENLKNLAEHRLHYVRWAAVQALCKMDFESGKGVLVEAIQDRHPHIARAASSSVRRLEAQGIHL